VIDFYPKEKLKIKRFEKAINKNQQKEALFSLDFFQIKSTKFPDVQKSLFVGDY